jgi:hypothetical protein
VRAELFPVDDNRLVELALRVGGKRRAEQGLLVEYVVGGRRKLCAVLEGHGVDADGDTTKGKDRGPKGRQTLVEILMSEEEVLRVIKEVVGGAALRLRPESRRQAGTQAR